MNTIDEALALLREDGWITNGWVKTNGRCSVGALRESQIITTVFHDGWEYSTSMANKSIDMVEPDINILAKVIEENYPDFWDFIPEKYLSEVSEDRWSSSLHTVIAFNDHYASFSDIETIFEKASAIKDESI